MQTLLYALSVRLYVAAIHLAALWNAKAKQWVYGRKGQASKLRQQIRPGERIIWMHCASAGELEQGKPVVEALKTKYPSYRILISFFSPSGYEAGRKYKGADLICYLPADTGKNAREFISVVQPELVIFVKYEYWYFHLRQIHRFGIPLLLVSAIFRPGQLFFRMRFFAKMLAFYKAIFVQDPESVKLLETLGISSINNGDTRFDRVVEIAEKFQPLDSISSFIDHRETLVAGSTWPEDEALIASAVKDLELCLIVAPHEINPSHLDSLKSVFPDSIFYSEWERNPSRREKVLIIDNFGMLSRLYHYGRFTYVGGGFNKSGIHNTLEAAVYGKPVFFGPNYQKFAEARGLVAEGSGIAVENAEMLRRHLELFLKNRSHLAEISTRSRDFVVNRTGATGRILQYLQENRLLTS